MSTQTLKDSQYRVIGYIETRHDGVQVGKDANYRVVGYYEPQTGHTKDAQYRVVCHGNGLAALVTSASS